MEVTLAHEPPKDYVSQPYVSSTRRRVITWWTGLIFEELSRQYLKEWGGDWVKQAPRRLVYLDRYPIDGRAREGRKRIVILSQVLPVASNIGYDDLK